MKLSTLKYRVSLCLFILSGATGIAFAVDRSEVPDRWHTPYGLYLDPVEAYQLKRQLGDRIAFIDVRTRSEVKFIGMASGLDGHVPVRFLRADYAWSERSNTYRTRLNPDFVADVDRLLASKGLDRQSPIILMCQSGSRAPVAARILHQAGFRKVYTQYQGFEGVKANGGKFKGQRVVNGWKNAGLPWRYDLDPEKMYFNFSAD